MNIDEHHLKTKEYLAKDLELQILQNQQYALKQYHYDHRHQQQHSDLKLQLVRI